MPEIRLIHRPPRVDPLLTSLAVAAGFTAISVIAARYYRQQHKRALLRPFAMPPNTADIPAELDTGADMLPAALDSPMLPATGRQQ